MIPNDSAKLVQDYVNFMGKIYIIMLSSLDEFFGAPLSTNEKVVLQILDEVPISIKEISLRTGLALSTLTNVIDKMEKKKLVRRKKSLKDRRLVEIELNVAGRRVQAKFNDLLREISMILLEFLPDKERKGFVGALEQTSDLLMTLSTQQQNIIGSLEQPLKLTFANQFTRKLR